MKAPPVVVIDFESKPIGPRPGMYPPEPVGVAIRLPTERKSTYMAWGHPDGNNSTKAQATSRLKQVLRDHTPLYHNAGFDCDVAETHLGIKWPAAWHDTLLQAFLVDPDSDSLSLKPLAQRYLDEPPTEQDRVRDWILANVKALDPYGKPPNKKNFGAFISLAPVSLVGPYACGDTDRTLGIFKHFWTDIQSTRLKEGYERELATTRVLIKMERRGVPVATNRLGEDVLKYQAVKREVETFLLKKMKVQKKLHEGILYHYDDQDDFKWSGKKFAERLISSGLVKTLPQTEKGNDSVSAESLAEVMPPKLAKEFEVRSQLQTCLITFMKPWLAQGRENDGNFYARFNQVRNGDEWGKKTGARTGRLSMTPNLQNVIRSDKDPRVPVLRDYIVPGKKYKGLTKRDYSQQELRLLAHYEDGPFKQAYIDNPNIDAHLLVRDLIRETVGMVLDRRPVKDLNFGLIYGQGLALTAQKMGLPLDQAKIARKAHAKSLPGIPKLQEWLKERVRAKEPIWTWGGRRYFCEKPVYFNGRWMTLDYKMLNKLIQGSAADVTKQAMVNYDSLGDFADENPIILQVHDELLNGVAQWKNSLLVHKKVGECMADIKDVSVPMLSDGASSRVSWHNMKKVKV